MNIAVDQLQFGGARPHRVTALEFWRMIDVDLFDGKRVELVEGDLIEMAPSNLPHAELVNTVAYKLRHAYGDRDWMHFSDAYVGLAPETVRAPDITIIARPEVSPSTLSGEIIWLAVEVSHTTLNEDLHDKRRDYAQAGVQHYWVVDVEGKRVHRFTKPENDDYAEALVSRFDEQMPLPGVEATISVFAEAGGHPLRGCV